MAKRGDTVLVRTYKGLPRLRRLWECSNGVCLVVEDEWFGRVEGGDYTWMVGLPVDDVFECPAGLQVDPCQPYGGWARLEHIRL